MAENVNEKEKKYLDQAGLNELVTQIKNRYDGSFTDIKIEKGTTEDKDVYNQDTDSTITYLKFKNAAGEMTPVDASQFIKDGMLHDVSIITLQKDETIKFDGQEFGAGDKLIKFEWNTDAGEKVDYIKLTELGKVYSAGDGVSVDDKTNAISVMAGKGVTVDKTGVSVKLSTNIKIDRTDEHGLAFLTEAFKDKDGNTVIPAGLTFEEFVNRIARIEKEPDNITLSDTCSYTQPTPTVSDGWPTLKLLTGYNAPDENTTNYIDESMRILKTSFGATSVTSNLSNDGYTGYVGSTFIFPNGSVNKPYAVTAEVSASFQFGYQIDEDGDDQQWSNVNSGSPATHTIILDASTNGFVIDHSQVKLKGTWGDTIMGEETWASGNNSISVKPTAPTATIMPGTIEAKYAVSGKPYSSDATNKKGAIPELKKVGYKNLTSFLNASSENNIKVPGAYAATSGVSKDKFNKGEWSGDDYVFKTDKITRNGTLSVSQEYTGVYPIFMNIVPEGTSTSKIDGRTIINKSSLITNTGSINLSNIKYNSTTGTYSGSDSLLAIPNSYITTYNDVTAIIIGDTGKSDYWSSDTKAEIPWIKQTGSDKYKLLLALPAEYTIRGVYARNPVEAALIEKYRDIPAYSNVSGSLKIGGVNGLTYTVYDISAKYKMNGLQVDQLVILLNQKLN